MGVHAYRHLPLMDFRPYSTGTHLPDKMSIPEGAPLDEYQTFLYYEKNGEIKEFTEDNFPWDDSTWQFVDTKHILISKGYEPLIHDFTIVDESGNDLVSDILIDPGYSFLMVCTHFEKADPEALIRADEFSSWCLANGHSFYCMTSSLEEDIQKVREELELGFGIYTSDEITLKTIIRSNPGFLLLKEGTILAKWHFNDMPVPEDLGQDLLPFTLTHYRKTLEMRSLGIFICLFLLLASFILYTHHIRNISR
jgi:hypothetical protein